MSVFLGKIHRDKSFALLSRAQLNSALSCPEVGTGHQGRVGSWRSLTYDFYMQYLRNYTQLQVSFISTLSYDYYIGNTGENVLAFLMKTEFLEYL